MTPEQAERIFAEAYEIIRAKDKWKNRKPDSTFDDEVDALCAKMMENYSKSMGNFHGWND